MARHVLAVGEQRDGTLRRVSFEALAAARAIAEPDDEVHALVIGGADVAAACGELAKFGADRILVAGDDALAAYNPDGYVDAAMAAAGRDYRAIVMGATGTGKDLAPRLAARLDVPLATDATGLERDGEQVVVVRPMYAGKAFATLVMQTMPVVVSIRPNVFRSEERAASGEIEKLDVDVSPDRWRVRVREFRQAEGETLDVGEAPIIVSGGRGLQGPEHWEILAALRQALGPQAALGASRAVVDAGWRPHSEQVGQTGKTVAPRVYFAVGISGAIQHLAGMRTAATIVAINKDADAPIFNVADYGIVGDAFDVIPRLTQEILKARKE
ncbi:MAG: electron transfer flavoprotein subunit alpha/FixB family protein [Longimicrobiales bacterium]